MLFPPATDHKGIRVLLPHNTCRFYIPGAVWGRRLWYPDTAKVAQGLLNRDPKTRADPQARNATSRTSENHSHEDSRSQ